MGKGATTRLTILEKAFELIYVKGYQATSVDDILATTRVTKGAFYHHFRNKDEMGIAIVEEVLRPIMEASFIAPISTTVDPLAGIYEMVHRLLLKTPFLTVDDGCPVGNMAHELSAWNRQFNLALRDLVEKWQVALIEAIRRGKRAGKVNAAAQPEQIAYFVMSGYWGIRNFGKIEGSNRGYKLYLRELKGYLESHK